MQIVHEYIQKKKEIKTYFTMIRLLQDKSRKNYQ
jgi:hypothetical protein